MNWVRQNLKMILSALATCFAIAWLAHDRQPAPVTNRTVVATPAKEVKNIPSVEVQMKAPVKIYSGGATIKAKVDMPAEVVKDDSQQIITSTKIDGEQPVTVTTVINTETGDSKTFVRTDPQSWLAWDDHGGVGMYAGFKNGLPAIRLQAHQDLFRIKSVHVSVIASLDQQISGTINLDSFVGIGTEYRW